MKEAEKNQRLGNNQTGGRNNMSAVETETMISWVVEVHRLTGQDLYIHQDNSMGCYNRIIHSHDVLNNLNFIFQIIYASFIA